MPARSQGSFGFTSPQTGGEAINPGSLVPKWWNDTTNVADRVYLSGLAISTLTGSTGSTMTSQTFYHNVTSQVPYAVSGMTEWLEDTSTGRRLQWTGDPGSRSDWIWMHYDAGTGYPVFTFMCGIWPTDLSANRGLFRTGSNTGALFDILSTGAVQSTVKVFSGIRAQATSPAATVSVGNRYVWTVTSDGVNLRSYINGSIVATSANYSGTTTSGNPDNPITWGLTADWYVGRWGMPVLFDKVLTPVEQQGVEAFIRSALTI